MVGETRIPVQVTIPTAGPMKGVISSFICYTATVKAFNLAEWEVQKTFDEYVALRKTLELGLGCRFPALPPTSWFGNADPNVIEERRQSVQKFATEALEVCLRNHGLRAEALWSFLQVPHIVRQVIYFLNCPELRNSKLVKFRELLPDDGSEDQSTPALFHASVLEVLLDMAKTSLPQEVGKALLETLTWQLQRGPDCWSVFFEHGGLGIVLDMGVVRDGSDVTEATATALRTLLVMVAPHPWREAVPWSQPLSDQLGALLTSSSGAVQESIASVLWATCGSSDEAARQFIYHAIGSDRKTLMNALFTSQSTTVKAFAGLLFARLLPFLERSDGYVVAQKTEEGLGHLLTDLCDCGDELWREERLFTHHPWRECVAELLLAPHKPARTFALFVLKKTGDGRGLRQYLAESLPGAETREERAALSELLISAWREDFEHGSGEDVMRISASLGDESQFIIDGRRKRLQDLRSYRSKQESTCGALKQYFSALSLPKMQDLENSFETQQAALAKLEETLHDAAESLQVADNSVDRQYEDVVETTALSSQLPKIWTDAAELLRRRNTARQSLKEMNSTIEQHEKNLETIGAERIDAEKERLLLSQECHKRRSMIERLEERARQSRHYAYAVLPELRTALECKKRDIEEKMHASGSNFRQFKRELSLLQQEGLTLKNPEDLEVEAKLAEEEAASLKEQDLASERAIAGIVARTRKIDAELEEASKPLPEFRQRRIETQGSYDEVVRSWDDAMLPHVQKEHTYFLDRWATSIQNVRDNEAADAAADTIRVVDKQFAEEQAARGALKHHCLALIDELQKVVVLLGD